MTRFIFTIFLTIITFQLNAQQVARQKVIVEVGTGTWCPSCPAVVAIIHDLENAGANIAVVEYHNNDSYVNADAQIREAYYSFPWFPTTYYDANHIGYDDWATYSVHLAYYEDRNNTPSSFQVSIVTGEVDNLAVSGTIQAENVETYAGSNLVLHIALTESNIPENWQGETELDYVERLMFPDGHGTSVDFSSDPIQDVSFNFNLDPTWVPSNCELVFFIQDNDTKEILQGNKINLDEINSLSVGNETSDDFTSIVFPNPVADTFSIQTENSGLIENIQLSDVAGRIVLQQDQYGNNIDISNLSKGMYMLSFIENGLNKTTKIIKK